MRPSNGLDAVVNIFEPIPASRITRAKIGDRALRYQLEPVDKLTLSMQRIIDLRKTVISKLNSYKPDSNTLYEP